ncbi:ABC transporter ATP-binding protein [Synechococcus sp. WH 7805]|nr:ABC transporter ATP-binding protein [Synechococcus sp. WH 7805]
MSESVFYQLPKGVKKMLALAQALIKDTPILLIDDFTQGLSAEQFDSFMDILPTLCQSELSGKMRSILIATDNHHILEQANQICILDNGLTTFQGSAEDLRKRLQQNA